MSVCKRCQVNI